MSHAAGLSAVVLGGTGALGGAVRRAFEAVGARLLLGRRPRFGTVRSLRDQLAEAGAPDRAAVARP
ncbi:hypothetical protein ABZ370_36020 [Streptomyces sp. NPDC005962]|uniref:hypothetical protein n=1 Tax=Streptomyces sp. NPDC005962 TaxID=3154466 RepID=UPI00340DBF66